MYHSFTAEANNQVGTRHERIEPAVGTQVADEVLSSSLPRYRLAQRNALGAEIACINNDSQKVGFWDTVPSHWAIPNQIPQRSGCERSCHMMDDIPWPNALQEVHRGLDVPKALTGSSDNDCAGWRN